MLLEANRVCILSKQQELVNSFFSAPVVLTRLVFMRFYSGF
jgi:hypothetical protein